jgi:hypothetical protein
MEKSGNDLQGAETTHHARSMAARAIWTRGSRGGAWEPLSAFASRTGGGVLLSGPDVLNAFSRVVGARQRQVVSFGKDMP